MTTMKDLVADTRRIAYGSMSDQLAFLAEEAAANATTLVMVSDVTPIQPGMVLSANLNVWYVISTDTSTKTVTVYPNYDNSRSDLVPVGTPVMIRPRVTDWVLFNAVNDAVRIMDSPVRGLYREASWEDSNPGYWNEYTIPDVAANMTNLIRVSIKVQGSGDGWWEVPPNSVQWQPEHGVIRLTTYGGRGHTVRFDYKSPFVVAADLTSDTDTDMNLTAGMLDIPPLGAAATLLLTTESRRTQIHAQGDPRRADEVPPGSNTMVARETRRRFEERMDEEYIRLINRNPYVRQI
jgi:hypothetical protein